MLSLCTLLACLALVYAQTPAGGGIGFGVSNPKAHIHSADNPGANVNIPIFRFDLPGLPNEAAWEHNLLHVNGVGQRDYSVYSFGYNMSGANTTEPQFGYRTEIDYEPNTGQRWIEHYLTFIHNGTVIRPFGVVIDRGTDHVETMGMFTQKMYWADDHDHQAMMGVFGETNSSFTWGSTTNTATFLFDQNNYAPLRQRTSTGGSLPLPFIDSANILRVGDDAVGVHLRSNVGLNSAGPNSIARMWVQSDATNKAGILVTPTFAGTQTAPLIILRNAAGNDIFKVMPNGGFYLWDGSALQPVTIGDNNSGGEGYRVLRIPNN